MRQAARKWGTQRGNGAGSAAHTASHHARAHHSLAPVPRPPPLTLASFRTADRLQSVATALAQRHRPLLRYIADGTGRGRPDPTTLAHTLLALLTCSDLLRPAGSPKSSANTSGVFVDGIDHRACTRRNRHVSAPWP